MKRTLFCLLALLAPAGVGASGPLDVAYYDMHGAALQDIGKWMNQHGPAGAREREYDASTRHGATQGARLQPGVPGTP